MIRRTKPTNFLSFPLPSIKSPFPLGLLIFFYPALYWYVHARRVGRGHSATRLSLDNASLEKFQACTRLSRASQSHLNPLPTRLSSYEFALGQGGKAHERVPHAEFRGISVSTTKFKHRTYARMPFATFALHFQTFTLLQVKTLQLLIVRRGASFHRGG